MSLRSASTCCPEFQQRGRGSVRIYIHAWNKIWISTMLDVDILKIFLVVMVTRLREHWVRFSPEARFFSPLTKYSYHPCHTRTHWISNGNFFLGSKVVRAWFWLPSNTKVKSEWRSTSSPPIRLHTVHRDSFALTTCHYFGIWEIQNTQHSKHVESKFRSSCGVRG
jgi:hypothetical protein